MFQMNQGALDAEMERRHEVVLATIRAAHRVAAVPRRVPDITRFRHVVALLVVALVASVR
jgi:hypothetical protein